MTSQKKQEIRNAFLPLNTQGTRSSITAHTAGTHDTSFNILLKACTHKLLLYKHSRSGDDEAWGNDISEQTQRVLENIKIVLHGLGLTLNNVVKPTVFLKTMKTSPA